MYTLSPVTIKTFTGAQILIKTLKNIGVDSIFGYPGSGLVSVYDELLNQNNIKHYLVRHEQAAVHAAEGYARISGKCGVVLVTSGPGATNTVTGIANAYLDGSPLVVLTGQVFKDLMGTDAFQDINIVDITKSCTKATYQVTSVDTLEGTLKDAFNCAMTGKKGPVVVDIAKNVFDETTNKFSSVGYEKEEVRASEENIKKVLEYIRLSSKPVIIAGGGVIHSGASSELIEFARKLNIPVVTTLMGIGSYPQNGTCYRGMIGVYGQKSSNEILRKADLILSFGARLNDRITSCFKNNELNGKIIKVDISNSEILKSSSLKYGVVSDIKYFLSKINSIIDDNYDYNAWNEQVSRCKILDVKRTPISNKLQSYEVINAIYNYTKSFNPIVTTEVGQHQMWVAQNYKFNYPNKLIMSGGLGTMGFGFPAAIGACIASGGQPVICIAGDGSFQMNEQELATCMDYKLPIKIFIMNNGYLGMVRQLQEKAYANRYSETKITNPDFVKLADSYGIKAKRVTKLSQIENALKEAFSVREPFIVDFVIEPMEVV